MAVFQIQFELKPHPRGFHLITTEVLRHLPPLPDAGLLHLFMLHTSAGLCINENADPDVLHDFRLYFDRLAPAGMPGMRHTLEGPDDMPAHIQSVLTGHDIHVPISKGRLVLGTWQGIYLCEFRESARARTLFASILT